MAVRGCWTAELQKLLEDWKGQMWRWAAMALLFSTPVSQAASGSMAASYPNQVERNRAINSPGDEGGLNDALQLFSSATKGKGSSIALNQTF